VYLPGYNHEIKIAIPRGVGRRLSQLDPDCIHIATEGTLGLGARHWCKRKRRDFSTSFHTKFAEYLEQRFGFPAAISWRFLRWFHSRAHAIMVNTESMRVELTQRGFRNLVHWGRGVDADLFQPRPKHVHLEDAGLQEVGEEYPRPYWLNVGRVVVEKNLEAFYQLDIPGTKIQVGEGPALENLRRKYPDVVFMGALRGKDLADVYSNADCFVFPSLTDTYGVVMLESMACGVPVAAMPSPGPSDIIENGINGVVDSDLRKAALAAIQLDPAACRASALSKGWDAATDEFERHLVPR
jgi:glycosyltransferase involved in cell wall biosynthesis